MTMIQNQTLYRIGIDVGGTFTHAVAIEANAESKLVGKVKVPTTHHSKHGVGAGVIESLSLLMKKCSIRPEQIILVAHSTTQATNSLLEGDVDPVGIVSIGSGWQGSLTKRGANLGRVKLSEGKYLKTKSYHIDSSAKDPEPGLLIFLEQCRKEGIKVIVVSGSFSVDDPSEELALTEFIRAQGFWVTPTHEVTQLYGVRVRTRTTAINASILPKMMEVADHTETEIRKAGITAPFMIMRSDGGIMSADEMRKKPVLTLLSGPAAGIAAALRYLKITDGIFVEVGGTSTDISVIKNGRALTRTAVIGGNPTFLRTLDCRTLGVGGGSLPRMKGDRVIEMGPRSAHIASVAYAAFSSDRIGSYLLSRNSVQPLSGDPSDYVVFESGDKTLRYGFTPTCAANVLGLVPDGDSSRANEAFPGPWDQVVDLKALSEEILRASSSKLAQTVEQLLLEYKLDRNWTTLVGGGGGASAIVPHLAKTLGMKFEIAKDNDVISAIGVALGLVREVVERSVVNPTHEDIYRIRGEAREKVIEQGADPAQIEVFIEVDTKKNVVRAEAQGTIEFKNNLKSGESTQGSSLDPADMSDDALSGLAKVALGLTVNPHVIKRARASRLSVATFSSTQKSFFGLRQSEHSYATVMDSRGVVRLRLSEPDIVESTAGTLVQTLKDNLDHQVTYDDGGTLYPQIFALLGDRIIDLSKLQTPDHFSTVLGMEAGEAPANEPAVLIFSKRNLEEEK